MPIDPSIPLSYKNPQVQNPLQVQQEQLSMAGMLQQQRIQAQQEQALDMENKQRALDLQDQQTIRQAYMDAGGDMDKFQQLVTQRGVSPKNLMQVNNSILEQKTKTAALTDAQLKIQQAHSAALSSEAQGLLSIKDPAERAAQYPAAVNRLVTAGHIPADVGQQMIAAGTPDDATLQMYYAHGVSGDKLAAEETAKRQAAAREMQAQAAKDRETREAGAAAADTAGKQAKSDQEVRANDAALLGAAADQGQAAYEKAWGQLPAARARAFPDPEEFDSKATPNAVRRLGMTSQQQMQEQGRANTNLIDQQRLDLERQRLQMERDRANRQSTADERQAQSEIQKLTSQEASLNQTRTRLAQAIGSGTTYIDAKGAQKPMATATIGADDSKQGMIDDMKARYQEASEALKTTIANKYDQYSRLGATPKIPLTDVHKAIDDGTATVLGPPKAATPGAAAPKPAATAAPAATGITGLLTPGNIDLARRPVVKNADGTTSTVRSMSFEENGKEVLVPTVAADGSRILSDQEAIDQYHKTGQHLGVFDTPANATAYAQKLHQDYASGKIKNVPPAQQPAAAAPKTYTIKGATYTVGQKIRSGNKDYIFRGLDPSGKIIGDPVAGSQ